MELVSYFAEHNCWVKKSMLWRVSFSLHKLFWSASPLFNRESTCFPCFSGSLILPTVCCLPQPQYNVHFLPYFPFSPPQFSLCSVFFPLHVVCLYVYIKFSLLLILWCICFCLLYLLGCICTALKVCLLKTLLSQQEAVPHSNSAWWLSCHFPPASQKILFPETLRMLL